MYIDMRSSSGLFHVHINAKNVNQFPAGKRKFTNVLRLVFGRNIEEAAVKL